MCMRCTASYWSSALSLMDTEDYQVAMLLKLGGWKDKTIYSYEVWSGGAFFKGSTTHCKQNIGNLECFAPTLDELNEKNGFESDNLKQAAIVWIVNNLYKNHDPEWQLTKENFRFLLSYVQQKN